jgi:1-acyl-sn-glycerol-3-phosphate acyltransferase
MSTENQPNIVDGSQAASDMTPVLETYALPLHLEEVWETDGVLQRPREVAPWLVGLAHLILRVGGWRLYGQLPDVPKMVLAAAFHTTNWDGFWMLVTAFAFGLRPMWMVKIEWVRGPLGWLVKLFGGLGIDRSHSRDSVQQAVDLIHERERIVLVISPEGTRRHTDHWKTGLYWIAYNANVPIVCGFLDYKHKRLGIGPVLIPSGDIDADMETLWAFYRNTNARHPEKVSDMRLRPGQHRSQKGVISKKTVAKDSGS